MTGENMYTIAMALISAAFILLVLFIMLSRMRGSLPYPICDVGDVIIGIIFPIVAIGCMMAAMVVIPKAMALTEKEHYDNVRDCINSGYTLWVNGTEVTLDHITLEDYSTGTISIDDETKEIHIAANR